MKLKVDENICIGCGACEAVCPECFRINEDGIAEVTVKAIPEEKKDDAIEAKEGCPAGAIKEEKKDDAIEAKKGATEAIKEKKEN